MATEEQRYTAALTLREQLHKLTKANRKLTSVIKDVVADTATCGETLAGVVGMLENDEGAMQLLHLANSVKALATFTDDFARSFSSDCIDPLDNFAAYFFVPLTETAKKLEKAKAELGTVQKKGAKGSVAADEVDRARREFAAATDEYRTELQDVASRCEPRLLSIVLRGTRALAALGKRIADTGGSVQGIVQGLDKIVSASSVSETVTFEGELLEKTLLGWQKTHWILDRSVLNCYRGRKGGSPDESSDVAHVIVKPCNGGGWKLSPFEAERAFELTMPSTRKTRTFVLMAATAVELQLWIDAINRAAVASAKTSPASFTIASSSSPSSSFSSQVQGAGSTRALELIRSVPGNQSCCDCSSDDEPSWVNTEIGTLLCAECAGAHRSIFVDEVLSPLGLLSDWDPVLIHFLKTRGNGSVNRLYESRLAASGEQRPMRASNRQSREEFLFRKYKEKEWAPLNSNASALDLGRLLLAACSRDVPPAADIFASLLCAGATVSAVDEFRQTPLHIAAAKGHLQLVEFLANSGANVNATDFRGWTPAHHAAYHNKPRCLGCLVAHGATLTDDPRGVSPMTAASWNGATECALVLLGVSSGNREQNKIPPLTIADVEADAIAEVAPEKCSVPTNSTVPEDTSVMLSAKVIAPTPSSASLRRASRERVLSRASSQLRLFVKTSWEIAKESIPRPHRMTPARLPSRPEWVPEAIWIKVPAPVRSPRLPMQSTVATRRKTIGASPMPIPHQQAQQSPGNSPKLPSAFALRHGAVAGNSPSVSQIGPPPLPRSVSSSAIAPPPMSVSMPLSASQSFGRRPKPPPPVLVPSFVGSPSTPTITVYAPTTPQAVASPVPVAAPAASLPPPPPPPPPPASPAPPHPTVFIAPPPAVRILKDQAHLRRASTSCPLPAQVATRAAGLTPRKAELVLKCSTVLTAVEALATKAKNAATVEDGLAHVRVLRGLVKNLEPTFRALGMVATPNLTPPEGADKMQMMAYVAMTLEVILKELLTKLSSQLQRSASEDQQTLLFEGSLKGCTSTLTAAGVCDGL